MEVYRIAKSKYIDDLSGEGSRIFGGRWNNPGLAVLYTSHARSLALLELIVHLKAEEALRDDFEYATIEINPTGIIEVPEKYGDNIFDKKSRWELQELTEDYFLHKNTHVLKVPSVLVPGEFNYLINPLHPHHATTTIKEKIPVVWDKRLKNMF